VSPAEVRGLIDEVLNMRGFSTSLDAEEHAAGHDHCDRIHELGDEPDRKLAALAGAA
jgi:hypothetical protein